MPESLVVANPAPAPIAKAIKKILVADDEPSICSVLKFFLEKEGYSVVVCGDGTEAVAQAKIEKFDLVILDGNMPVMNGPEAAKEILRHCNYSIPIVFYSSNPEVEEKAPVGCSFVLKDANGLSKLVRKVEQILGGESDGNTKENPGRGR